MHRRQLHACRINLLFRSGKAMKKYNVTKLALMSMLLCLAVILGYVEAILPVQLPVPGIRLGLANYAIVMVLYLFGVREAYTITILRVVLVGLLFTNLSMMLYSMAGTIAAVSIMYILKKSTKFSVIGVSIAGAVMHNSAQLAIAMLLFSSGALIGYFPWLLLAGIAAGCVIGLLVQFSYKRIYRIYQKYKEHGQKGTLN